MIGTPETDAMVEQWESFHIPADFARRMENERNEALSLADRMAERLQAITNSEPSDYLGLVHTCKLYKEMIAQLVKEKYEEAK
jgi:hypothetical protein